MGVIYIFKEVIDNLNSKNEGYYPHIFSQDSISAKNMIEALSCNSVEQTIELQKLSPL